MYMDRHCLRERVASLPPHRKRTWTDDGHNGTILGHRAQIGSQLHGPAYGQILSEAWTRHFFPQGSRQQRIVVEKSEATRYETRQLLKFHARQATMPSLEFVLVVAE